MLTSRFNLVPEDVRIAQVAYQRFNAYLPSGAFVALTMIVTLPLAQLWRGICC
jgi:hypothetical protein